MPLSPCDGAISDCDSSERFHPVRAPWRRQRGGSGTKNVEGKTADPGRREYLLWDYMNCRLLTTDGDIRLHFVNTLNSTVGVNYYFLEQMRRRDQHNFQLSRVLRQLMRHTTASVYGHQFDMFATANATHNSERLWTSIWYFCNR